MDVDSTNPSASHREEVSMKLFIITLSSQTLQSPWIPELETLFDDIGKTIAPGNAYGVIR